MFTQATRDYFNRAQGYGLSLEDPTHQGQAGAKELGHHFQVQLKIKDHLIEDLTFYCPRCLPAIACGGYLYQTLIDQPVERAASLTSQEILEALGGLPISRSFYAWMAVEAIQQALGGTRD
jgi:nitrogen fixation NifU-like protein